MEVKLRFTHFGGPKDPNFKDPNLKVWFQAQIVIE